MSLQRSTLALALVCASILVFAACSKDEEEAEKFLTHDQAIGLAGVSELKHIRLDNGIAVYLQEEHSLDYVAIEFVYEVGLVSDPRGLTNLSHLLEHVRGLGNTTSFEGDKIVSHFQSFGGHINAQTVANLAHYDFVVPSEHVEDALKLEYERLTSLSITPELLKREAARAGAEGARSVADGRSVNRYGLIALNQAMRYGAKSIDLEESLYKLTIEQLQQFHNSYYQTDKMIISLVGNIQTEAAEALVRKYFEGLPLRPSPPTDPITLTADKDVTWDIGADAMYLVFPGPYEDFKQRMALTMFGIFLKSLYAQNQELQTLTNSNYANNQTNPVAAGVPFFIYAEPRGRMNYDAMRQTLLTIADQAAGTIDESRLGWMKESMLGFMRASLLSAERPHQKIPHFQVLGQEAMNIAMRHILREGRSPEEFEDVINSITLQYMDETLHKFVRTENMHEVHLIGG